MDSPVRFTRPLLALMIGVPLAWAVLLWFHPDVDPNHVYADLREDVHRAYAGIGMPNVSGCRGVAATSKFPSALGAV